MLRATISFGLLGGTTLLIAACGTTNPGETAYMKATVEGSLWQAEYVRCVYAEGIQLLYVDGKRVVAGDSTYRVELELLPGAVGTFTLGSDGPTGVIRVADFWGYETFSGWHTTDELGGSVTVTELDVSERRCSGTFSFTAMPFHGAATDPVAVANGSWTVELTISD